MDYYKETPPLEFIRDLYDIMKDGDCLSPEKLNADVVDMLGNYISAQQSVQAVTNTCPYCGGTGKGRMNGIEVGCIMCSKTGRRQAAKT